MSKFLLPTPHIALPEDLRGCLSSVEALIISGCALVNETCALITEVRTTNRLLQQVLQQQIEPAERRKPRVST